MNLGADFFAATFTISTIFLLTLIPLPGTNFESQATVQKQTANIEVKDSVFLEEDSKVVGTHDMVSDNIVLASGSKSTLQFLSLCNHEVRHFKFDVADRQREDPLTTEEEHEKMSGLGDSVFPWNWQESCLKVTGQRFNSLI